MVVSVVDERTLGPVTRSRLTLRVQPDEGEVFEVTTEGGLPDPRGALARQGWEHDPGPL